MHTDGSTASTTSSISSAPEPRPVYVPIAPTGIIEEAMKKNQENWRLERLAVLEASRLRARLEDERRAQSLRGNVVPEPKQMKVVPLPEPARNEERCVLVLEHQKKPSQLVYRIVDEFWEETELVQMKRAGTWKETVKAKWQRAKGLFQRLFA